MLLISVVSLVIIGGWKARVREASLISVTSIAVLVLYPSALLDNLFGGIAAALLGAILLFVNVWAWIDFPRPYTKFLGVVAALGLLFGLAVALIEGFVEGSLPEASKILLVISVFVGIGSFGILLGYLFLGSEFVRR